MNKKPVFKGSLKDMLSCGQGRLARQGYGDGYGFGYYSGSGFGTGFNYDYGYGAGEGNGSGLSTSESWDFRNLSDFKKRFITNFLNAGAAVHNE